MKPKWRGNSMKLADVRKLEEIFAEYKGELGWVIPKWLVVLKLDLIARDMEYEV